MSNKKRNGRASIGLAALSAAALVLTACGSGEADDTADGFKSFTVAVAAPPVSLDPYLQNLDPTNNWFINLAYDSLIRIDESGELVPDLATEWGFTDDENTQFELTLREGVEFSDGEPMTAEGVAASLNRALTDSVNGPTYWSLVTSITAKDEKTILFESSAPNPSLPRMVTERVLLGSIISPAGLDDLEGLKSKTYGAGPYVLDSESTVANDTYVYVPNEKYWAPEKIHWDEVKIKVVANPAAALQAVQNGEAQLTRGDSSTYAGAVNAGLHTELVALGLIGVNYVDRNGEIAPELADVRVRQALNYAMDKKAIAQATFGDMGSPGGQLALKGSPGFDEEINNAYPYDPDKAKKLLAEAGYADGFTIPVEVVSTSPNADILVQAVLSDWAKVGVIGDLTTYADTGQAVSDIIAKKWPITYYGYGALNPFTVMGSFLSGQVNQYNPWGTTDPELTRLVQEASVAPVEEQDEAIAKAMKYAYVDLAWTGGVVHTSYPYISDATKITGTAHSPDSGTANIAWGVRPAN